MAGCASEIIDEDWWEGMQSYYAGLPGNKALVLNVTQQSDDNFVYARYYGSAQPKKTRACLVALKTCVDGARTDGNLKPGGCRIIAVNDTWNANREDFAYDDDSGDVLMAGLAAGLSSAAGVNGQSLQSYELGLESQQATNDYNSRQAFDPKLLPPDCH